MFAHAAFALTPWSEHTPESRELAEDILTALRLSGYSQKAMALEMEQLETHVSAQLAGKAHLSAWRLARLSQEFWRQLAKVRLQRMGRCLVIDTPELMEILSYVRGQAVKAQLRAKRNQQEVA